MLQPFKNYELPHYTEYKMLQTFNTLKQSIALQPTEYKVGDAVIFVEDFTITLPINCIMAPCPNTFSFASKGDRGYIKSINPANSGGVYNPETYKIELLPKTPTQPVRFVDNVPAQIISPTIIGNEVLQAVWYGTKPSQKLIAAAIIALLIYFIAKKFKK